MITDLKKPIRVHTLYPDLKKPDKILFITHVQIVRFWDKFNYDLYRKIIELKKFE